MFNRTTWRSLKIAATRNQAFKRKVFAMIASAAILSMAAASFAVWLGYMVMTQASTQIQNNLTVLRSVDIRSCIASVSEWSRPGYWLDTTLEKTIGETLAHCRSKDSDECQGDACLDTGKRDNEVKV
jgi:hypothetical protein